MPIRCACLPKAHDFLNPFHPEMGFDVYKGKAINEEMANRALSEIRSDYRILYPNYTSSDLGWGTRWPRGIGRNSSSGFGRPSLREYRQADSSGNHP